jgi:ribonuclease Z
MIRVTFLGTATSRPTVARNVSAVAIQREGDHFLFDCGEGTQRQMMRFATGFSLNDIFITHIHADHYLGVIGLLRTLGLQGREEPMRLWTPTGTRGVLEAAVHLGVERVPFPISISELEPGQRVPRDGYDIVAFGTRHGIRSLGYALAERPRLGRFDIERARALGVPEGPLFGRLHRGESVQVDGRTIDPSDVVGAARAGRTVVYTGDTRPAPETEAAARDADLLIHDATFDDEEEERAGATGHSTARQAGRLAAAAGAHRLVLTHVSSRYSENARRLEREARAEFPASVVAFDGMTLELPYRDD